MLGVRGLFIGWRSLGIERFVDWFMWIILSLIGLFFGCIELFGF